MMLREKRRIGLFGGTFDPFHYGHLEMARAAVDALNLYHVTFIPAGRNPLKGEPPVATARQRVEMIRLGIENQSRFSIWEGELERSGPSYTLETVEHISRVYPNCHLFWIIGSDQLEHLHHWYGIEKLVDLVGFILVKRPGFTFAWPGVRGLRIYPVDNPLVPVSSTKVRQKAALHQSLTTLVPPAVGEYITGKGIYV